MKFENTINDERIVNNMLTDLVKICLDAREQKPNAIWMGTNVTREAFQRLLDHETNSISMES